MLGAFLFMKIICPQCNFLKNVSADRFPSSSFMATCPKCRHRFRISIEDNEIARDKNLLDSVHSKRNVQDDDVENVNVNEDDVAPPNSVSPHNYQKEDTYDNNSEIRKTTTTDENIHNNEDLRKTANNAYENESKRSVEQEINDGFSIDNPWENAHREGYISSFYQTVIRIMFFAPRFFAGLSSDVSLVKALIFYIIIVVIQVLISSFWASTLLQYIASTPHSNDDVQTLLSYISESNLPMTVLVKTAFSVMQLYVSSLVYYLAFSIVVKDKVNFPLIFQVIAYSVAPFLLSIVPLLGSLVGMVWAIACSFIGCRYALRLTIMQTALALAPIYMLILPLLYIIISTPV